MRFYCILHIAKLSADTSMAVPATTSYGTQRVTDVDHTTYGHQTTYGHKTTYVPETTHAEGATMHMTHAREDSTSGPDSIITTIATQVYLKSTVN